MIWAIILIAIVFAVLAMVQAWALSRASELPPIKGSGFVQQFKDGYLSEDYTQKEYHE